MSQPDTELRQHPSQLPGNIFKSSDGRTGAKRPRERSVSPTLGDTMNLTSARGRESEEPLLSFSDLIRPLSATPSPEPSLPSNTPPRTQQIRETMSFPFGVFNGKHLDDRISPSGEEERDELMDDARVAEVRRMVIAWDTLSRESGSEHTSSSRERQLAMMVMALTHPARPTASQVAAQAEDIRSLLAERSDLNEFRHADRMSFERTAQALSARAAQRSAKWNGSSLATRETVYEDERSRTMDVQVLQEKLIAENSRLEHDLHEARREIAVLKQSIEDLRISVLIRPQTIPSSLTTSHNEVVIPPTPNPRGRPRKYPLPSLAGNQGFQVPIHSNPGAQLPSSSSAILSIPNGSTQPPEKRLRGAQPDARAELLIAAARRVGKNRVLKALEVSEAGNTTGGEEPKLLAEDLVSQSQLTQTRMLFQHSPPEVPIHHTESSPTGGTDPTIPRRGRPPRASISLPATAHHQFTQFPVDDSGRPISVRGRSSKLRPTKSEQEADRNTVGSSPMGDSQASILPVPANQTPRRTQTQQVVVPFTGDPQVDAQSYLASRVAQYHGIQTTPPRNTAKTEAGSGLEDALGSRLPHGDSLRSMDTTGQCFSSTVQVTPDRNTNDARGHGLEHLLSAARTMLRARSQSTSPTPQRQLTSNSALASPHHISTRKRHSPSLSHSNSIAPVSRRHSSPLVQAGDSDTEPDEPESQGRGRVYSALDVLADQAAAARTSPPDLLVDRPDSSPERSRPFNPPKSFPVTPEPHATLFAPRARDVILSSPMAIIPASDPPQLSSSSTSPSTLDTVDNPRRALSEEPLEQNRECVPESSRHDANVGLGETASITSSVSRATTFWASGHTKPTPMSDAKVAHPENPPYTPPRSEKLRGKQRA